MDVLDLQMWLDGETPTEFLGEISSHNSSMSTSLLNVESYNEIGPSSTTGRQWDVMPSLTRTQSLPSILGPVAGDDIVSHCRIRVAFSCPNFQHSK